MPRESEGQTPWWLEWARRDAPFRWTAAALLALSLVASIERARTKPFWYDEVITLHVTALPSIGHVWQALASAIDSQTIFYHLIIRPFGAIGVDPHVAYRLPSIAGYLLALVGTWVFTRRRYGSAGALLAFLILALTPLRSYAVEARAYALLVGFIAVAAAAWQRAGEGRWATPSFTVALMLATASHHFAIAALACFAIAEATVVWFHRRIRWPVWAGIAVATGPLLFSLPLLLGMHGRFATHFWSPAALDQIPSTYNDMLGISGASLVLIALFIGLGSLAMRVLGSRSRAVVEEQPERLPSLSLPVRATASELLWPEFCLIVLLVLFPVWLVVPSWLVGSGYVSRYAMPLVLGVAVGTAALLYRLGGRGVVMLALLPALVIFVPHEVETAAGLFQGVAPRENTFDRVMRSVPLASEGHRADLPVVISSGIDYVPFTYYAGPAKREPYVMLVNPGHAVRLLGTDSIDREVMLLSEVADLGVEDADAFIDRHPAFYMYAARGRFSWLPQYLAERGMRLSILNEDSWAVTYLVEAR